MGCALFFVHFTAVQNAGATRENLHAETASALGNFVVGQEP